MPLYSIGAFAIIFDTQGRVLLCHRRDIDAWNLPGGGVESGELPTEAAIRETREEAGLNVAIERLVGVYGKPEKDEIAFAFECRGTKDLASVHLRGEKRHHGRSSEASARTARSD